MSKFYLSFDLEASEPPSQRTTFTFSGENESFLLHLGHLELNFLIISYGDLMTSPS